jgi:hypothetical protein
LCAAANERNIKSRSAQLLLPVNLFFKIIFKNNTSKTLFADLTLLAVPARVARQDNVAAPHATARQAHFAAPHIEARRARHADKVTLYNMF